MKQIGEAILPWEEDSGVVNMGKCAVVVTQRAGAGSNVYSAGKTAGIRADGQT